MANIKKSEHKKRNNPIQIYLNQLEFEMVKHQYDLAQQGRDEKESISAFASRILLNAIQQSESDLPHPEHPAPAEVATAEAANALFERTYGSSTPTRPAKTDVPASGRRK